MLFSTLFLATLMQGAAMGDPLAPARAGMLQCYTPDVAAKRCTALASYAPDGAGFANRAEVRLSTEASPLITMITTSKVWVDHGRVCGKIEQAELDTATFQLDGATMPEGGRAQMVKAITAVYSSAGVLGHVLCTSYVPAGDLLSARVEIDGVAHPELTQKVRWVKTDEGFAVR